MEGTDEDRDLFPSQYVPKRYLLCERVVIEAYQYMGVRGGKSRPQKLPPWMQRKQQGKPFVLHKRWVNEEKEVKEEFTEVAVGHWVVNDPTYAFYYVMPPKVFSIHCREVPDDTPIGVIDPNSDLIPGNEWHEGVPTEEEVGDDEECWVTDPVRRRCLVTGRKARGIKGMAWRRFVPFAEYKEKKPEPGDVWFNPETGDRACVIGKMPGSDLRIVAAMDGDPFPFSLQEFLDLFPKYDNKKNDSGAASPRTDDTNSPGSLKHKNGKVQEKADRDRGNPVQKSFVESGDGPGRSVPAPT